jgi:hypothetical protein
MLEQEALLAGGDWNICYSQEETDAVLPSYPAAELPFDPAWPPYPGRRTRLGSGTGQRGTFGPATMWRAEAHFRAPRYPWRFSDGSLIRSAGDAAWWMVVGSHLRGKCIRLPLVIGHYHCHPQDQAEFR